ncbi:hypothetical protein ACHAXR_011505 [Thalassiosira sp. AJA248-18]
MLNEGLLKIGSGAFYNCKSLKSVKFPSTLSEIGNISFWGSRDLRQLVLNEGLRQIGERAFADCSSLESINVPSTLSEVGDHTFRDCIKLKVVVLNKGLLKIGQYAFDNCTSLEGIKFPSTLSEIGSHAFWGSRNLRQLVLNEGLRKLGHYAFAYCKSLESIKFPSTLCEIGKYALWSCINLQEVVLNGGRQKFGRGAFAECSSLEIFKFPNISTRLKAIPHAAQTEVESKINEIPDFVLSGGDILISVTATSSPSNWEGHSGNLDRIIGLVTYYELKEATTIFELALWKANIDIDNNLVGKTVKRAKINQNEAANIDNRKEYLMEVPDPVKDSVLQYFSYNQGW